LYSEIFKEYIERVIAEDSVQANLWQQALT